MNRRSKRGGFSLIEVLAVMAVIVVLTGLSLFVARSAAQRADIARTQMQLQKLMGALDEYRLQNGAYPASLSAALTYLSPEDQTSNDPWGRAYQYVRESNSRVLLFSLGPDGFNQTNPAAAVGQRNDDIRADRPH
jgi:general secretion pathway protein G